LGELGLDVFAKSDYVEIFMPVSWGVGFDVLTKSDNADFKRRRA